MLINFRKKIPMEGKLHDIVNIETATQPIIQVKITGR